MDARSPELQSRLRSSRKPANSSSSSSSSSSRTVLTDGGSRVLSRATPGPNGGRSSHLAPSSRDAASESAQRSAVAGLASPGYVFS